MLIAQLHNFGFLIKIAFHSAFSESFIKSFKYFDALWSENGKSLKCILITFNTFKKKETESTLYWHFKGKEICAPSGNQTHDLLVFSRALCF